MIRGWTLKLSPRFREETAALPAKRYAAMLLNGAFTLERPREAARKGRRKSRGEICRT